MEKLFWPRVLSLVLLVAACVMACKDDDKPKLIPEVTTAVVTEITPNTAMGGGEITSDGNDKITVSGICWSSTATTPTTADNKSELNIFEGTFASKMENLPSGSTIYVRAYATNTVGTGYGNVRTFTTGNAAPVASNVAISGIAEVNKTLTGTYNYSDAEGNAESGTTIQWYRANDASATGEVAIAGATTATYVLQDVDEFKFIRFGVTPRTTNGNTNGVEVKSSFVGPIAVRTTVTFIYNSSQVTYGIITSPVTGRKWLDRNLGAPNTPTVYNDYANYGDLFQWGRGADGHQLVIRNATNKTITPVNSTIITSTSASDNPGHSMFINPGSPLPRDWRSPQNGNLWGMPGALNNPCPDGWHIPSENEWDAEKLNLIQDAFKQIRITYAGEGRNRLGAAGNSFYWSSSPITSSGVNMSIAYSFQNAESSSTKTSDVRAAAFVCRCINNQ